MLNCQWRIAREVGCYCKALRYDGAFIICMDLGRSHLLFFVRRTLLDLQRFGGIHELLDRSEVFVILKNLLWDPFNSRNCCRLCRAPFASCGLPDCHLHFQSSVRVWISAQDASGTNWPVKRLRHKVQGAYGMGLIQIYSVSFWQGLVPFACGSAIIQTLMIMETTRKNQSLQVAEIQLVYRSHVKAAMRPQISTSKDAEAILRQTWDADTIEFVEHFKILLVNRANKVLGVFDVSQGGITGTAVDLKVIFVCALKTASSGIILSHNHPSGNLTPSQSDIDLTRKIKEAGKYLEISVLDHIILTSESYFSFADEGLLWALFSLRLRWLIRWSI